MLKSEIFTINEKTFIKHYSDNNKYIIQSETGNEYTEAVNPYPSRYTYTETKKDIITEIF